MKSYTAQIIYRIECEGVSTEQYEEQWRLVYANDDQTALDEAKKAGMLDEGTFIDRHGRNINWRMLAVKHLQPVELKNGGLLFSMVHEPEMVASPVWAV